MNEMQQQLLASAPPPMGQVMQQESAPGKLVAWNDHVVREALRTEVGRHCCWGKSAVDAMQITQLDQTSCYYVKVTTFLETRDVNQHTTPYLGDYVDGPQNGQPPQLWEMQVSQPSHFEQRTYQTTVPHTEAVSMCQTCVGQGKCQCTVCQGMGNVLCGNCEGRGQIRCTRCSGKGVPRTVDPDRNWNGHEMCDGKRAQDRVDWLVKEQGLTDHAAKVRVKREFPLVFGGKDWWNPTAMCDGSSAQERAEWLVSNEGLSEHDARARLKKEFPSAFSTSSARTVSLVWDGSVMCDGSSAQERAEWLVSNEGLSQEDARARLKKEFPSAFSTSETRKKETSSARTVSLVWDGSVMCDGVSADERVQWLVENERLTLAEARQRIKSEFPDLFGDQTWDPNALCDGTSAADRAQWLVDNMDLSMEDAKKKVQSEFPTAFPKSPTSSKSLTSPPVDVWSPEDDDHCEHCVGKGIVVCKNCEGRCRVDCKECQARGMVVCTICQGKGQLKTSLQLHVRWANIVVDQALNGQGVAQNKREIEAAQGPQSVVQGLPVQATTQFPPAVNEATRRLCELACANQQKGLIHMQRMVLKQVPVCQISAIHNGKPFNFTILGEEMRVKADEYPMKCCWGCTIA